MRFKIRYKPDVYKSDMIKFYINELKNDKIFLVFIFIYVVIFTIFLLNDFRTIDFFPPLFELLTVSLGVGIFFMISHRLFYLFRRIREIKFLKSELPSKEEYFEIKNNKLIFSWNNSVYDFKIDNYKDFLILDKAIFFVPEKKHTPLFRVNQDEIGNLNFSELIKILRNKA
ncbi:MAG: hypothetical protein R3353_00285 [Salegentibacter mishustinae]|nr:hypothetical protein [Salegentibacter mishustinae]